MTLHDRYNMIILKNTIVNGAYSEDETRIEYRDGKTCDFATHPLDLSRNSFRHSIMHMLGYTYLCFPEILDAANIKLEDPRTWPVIITKLREKLPGFKMHFISVTSNSGIDGRKDMYGYLSSLVCIRIRSKWAAKVIDCLPEIVAQLPLIGYNNYEFLCHDYAMALLWSGNEGSIKWAPKNYVPAARVIGAMNIITRKEEAVNE